MLPSDTPLPNAISFGAALVASAMLDGARPEGEHDARFVAELLRRRWAGPGRRRGIPGPHLLAKGASLAADWRARLRHAVDHPMHGTAARNRLKAVDRAALSWIAGDPRPDGTRAAWDLTARMVVRLVGLGMCDPDGAITDAGRRALEPSRTGRPRGGVGQRPRALPGERLSTRIPAEAAEALRARVEATGKPPGVLVREAILDWLSRVPRV